MKLFLLYSRNDILMVTNNCEYPIYNQNVNIIY